jgi:type IV pilus assembly protein PilW
VSGQRIPAGKARGLSLVELMVAIALGLVLAAGAISIFVSNKRNYEVTEDLSRLQENARFAIEAMLDDLRMAGHVGCSHAIGNLRNLVGASVGDLADFGMGLGGGQIGLGLRGIDNADPKGSTWSPTSSTDLRNRMVAGTDAVTVRYVMAPGASLTGRVLRGGSTVPVDTGGLGFTPGGLAAITDCGSGVLFRLSSDDIKAGELKRADSTDLGRDFDPPTGSEVFPTAAPVRALRYYVGSGRAGGTSRSLFRAGEGEDPGQELVEGVEDMQLLYGVDTNGDRRPDVYLPAGHDDLNDESEWEQTVSVRMGLLLRTVDEYDSQVDNRAYDLFTGRSYPKLADCAAAGSAGCVDPPDLRVRRRVFSTTVYLRNYTSHHPWL